MLGGRSISGWQELARALCLVCVSRFGTESREPPSGTARACQDCCGLLNSQRLTTLLLVSQRHAREVRESEADRSRQCPRGSASRPNCWFHRFNLLRLLLRPLRGSGSAREIQIFVFRQQGFHSCGCWVLDSVAPCGWRIAALANRGDGLRAWHITALRRVYALKTSAALLASSSRGGAEYEHPC